MKKKGNPDIQKRELPTDESIAANAPNIQIKGVFEKSDSELLQSNSFGNCFVPFGFGQFKNGNTKRGYIFMTSQIVYFALCCNNGCLVHR